MRIVREGVMTESSMLAILKGAIAFDERLDSESRSPDGDDYNVVMNLVRAAIAEASVPVAAVDDPFARAALKAGWVHGGDGSGFWFHEETWGDWKAAASWSGTDQEPEEHGAIYDNPRELCEGEDLKVRP